MTDLTGIRSTGLRGGPAAHARHPHSVSHYAVANVPTARLDEGAAAVRERLAGKRFDCASHVFVLNGDGRLAGVIEITDLVAADSASPIAALMKATDLHVVSPQTDREEAASLAIRTGVSALAMCDADGHFVGAVPAAALMSILRDEHVEDLYLIAGILGQSAAAKASLMAPPLRRAFDRLPWVVIGLIGSSMITAIMAQFETTLTANIAVAFFIPALVYLADAVGTQTEVVAVRMFSLTETSFGRFFAAEVGTGAIIGLILSAIALPAIWVVFGSFTLGLTVAVALVVATTVSTAVGFLLPWTFDRCGFDPALGSGPIATVFQDALTLLVYFLVAATLLLR